MTYLFKIKDYAVATIASFTGGFMFAYASGDWLKFDTFGENFQFANTDRTRSRVLVHRETTYADSVGHGVFTKKSGSSPSEADLDYFDWMVLGTHYSRFKKYPFAAQCYFMSQLESAGEEPGIIPLYNQVLFSVEENPLE
eukprot:Nk52_evm78s221 gene=Nk52_evmTU78s221